jgi:hypothetical protein
MRGIGIDRKNAQIIVAVAFLFSVLISPLVANNVFAAALTQTFVRFDRMKTSTFTSGTVCAKAATAGTEATVKVTFPTGYTVSTTLGNWTVNTTNLAWPTGGTAWPSIATATAAAGQDVTFPSGDLVVGTLYCFNWTNTAAALQTKSTATSSNAGTITTQTSAPATIDSGDYSTATITDDQIVVTATVPQAFSFALSGNTDQLGTLSTASVGTSPTPRTVTVNTNAKNGWMVWAKDLNTGLTSASAGDTIASRTPGTNSTLTAGTEGYNTGVTSTQTGGSGTITIATPFNGAALGQGGGLDTSLRSIATSTGTANNAVLTLKNNVTISSTTAAATDYTDTITVIGAGLF